MAYSRDNLAALLNRRDYLEEITPAEAAMAKVCGLVVIFGYSDDNIELEGAIRDEVGSFNGTTIHVANGKLLPPIDDDDVEALQKYGVYRQLLDQRKAATAIKCERCKDDYAWYISTDAPHSTFDIFDDGEKFCRGIVIDLKEIP